jgi:capsular polysaccharide biosynthesis protein
VTRYIAKKIRGFFRRHRFVAVGAALLFWRRLKSPLRRLMGKGETAGVRRVLSTKKAVTTFYQTSKIQNPTPYRLVIHRDSKKNSFAVTTLRQVRVISQPVSVITEDWNLLWPYAPQLQKKPLSCDIIWKTPGISTHLAQASYFAGIDGFSYYHWILGTLPLLVLSQKLYGKTLFPHYIVNQKHKKVDFQTASLRSLGIPLKNVRWLQRPSHYFCDELVIPPCPSTKQQRHLKPWAFTLLRDHCLPWAKKEAQVNGDFASALPKKFFISRAKTRRRRLVNEDDLSKALESEGYATLYLEDWTLAQQINLFAQAQVVVGLHGAGLANLVFARPETKVVELLPDHWMNPCFQNLAAQAGLSYTFCVAKSTEPKRKFAADARVEIEKVLQLLPARG